MIAVYQFAARLGEAFPLAAIVVDPPLAQGKYFVDIRLGRCLVAIEWNEVLGIGVSLIDEPALEGGPDMRLFDVESVFRIVKLLLTKETGGSPMGCLGV